MLGERDHPAQGQWPAVAPRATPDPQPRIPPIDRLADNPQDIDATHRFSLYNHPVGDHAIDEHGQPRWLVRRWPLVLQQIENSRNGHMVPEDLLQSDLFAAARAWLQLA